jgi:hypothetical protein
LEIAGFAQSDWCHFRGQSNKHFHLNDLECRADSGDAVVAIFGETDPATISDLKTRMLSTFSVGALVGACNFTSFGLTTT